MYPVRPWLNYAWNDKYASSFDQFGFGISRYTDPKGYVKNILCEGDNRLIFVKDNESGEYYAANRNYDNAPFDTFETTVGQGYSKITSVYQKIKTEFKIFTSNQDYSECWEVNAENLSEEEKDFSVYIYAAIDTGSAMGAVYQRPLCRRRRRIRNRKVAYEVIYHIYESEMFASEDLHRYGRAS